MMRVAAIQLETVIGDIEANLSACQRLADAAAHEGAEWIILPEFLPPASDFYLKNCSPCTGTGLLAAATATT